VDNLSVKTTLYIILVFAILFFGLNSFGQADSSMTDKSGVYNAIRVGIGLEKSPYLELGFSRLGIVDKSWPGAFCFYAAGQLNVSHQEEHVRYIYGGKVGFETAWMIGMWGAEIKYLTNNKESQVYFTPKVGFSAVGFVSILYGYNVPRKDKLDEIGSHQISITLNWSKKLVGYFK
jgi:hypothetical protein